MSDFQHFFEPIRRLPVTVCSILACAGVFGAALAYGEEWVYSSADASIVIDPTSTGGVTQWKVGGKQLIDAKAQGDGLVAPLELETEEGGLVRFKPESYSEEKSKTGAKLLIKGKLAEPYHLGTTLEYEIAEGGAQMIVRVQTEASGAKGPKIRRMSWQQPLALAPRKRVYFRGAHGLDWETRYFYQYVANVGGLLPHADRNEWQLFSLDQLTPTAFRLWKAESDATAPLVMQEGESLPPYLQVYDSQGGVTLEYRQLAALAPKSLRVNATKGASVEVSIWPLSSPSVSPESPGIFGVKHEMILTAGSSEWNMRIKRAEQNLFYPEVSRPKAEESMKEAAWLRQAENAPEVIPLFVTGGYPFPQGKLKDTSLVSVAAAGERVPVQTKVLGYWPDRSIKWLLLTFPVQAEKAQDAEAEGPRVTFRQGKSLPVSVDILAAPEVQPEVSQAIKVEQPAANQVSVTTGDFAASFSTGEKWLAVKHSGDSLLAANPATRLAYSDYLIQPERVFPFAHEAKGGRSDKGALVIQSVSLEESGPLRAVVRLEGMTANAEPTRIILRAEIYAGRPEIRFTYSSEFLFKDPRKTFLSGLGLSFPLVDVQNVRLSNTAASVASADLRLVQTSYFGQRREPVVPAHSSLDGGWLEADSGAVRVIAAIRNFRETAPKAIGINAQSKELTMEFWPSDAPVMDVRRYSNYPHLGQGEGVLADTNWVEKDYYPNDPFVGISRTHQASVGFWPKDKPMPSAQTSAADFQSPPLLYAGWQRYAESGVTLPAPSQEAWPEAWRAWTSFANFWLYHRSLHSWYGFWDFGDLRHHFRSGAGWVLPTEMLLKATKGEVDQATISQKLIWDAAPANDWAYDNGRWGWGNTEGLPNLFLTQEYLRHGNRSIYFASQALAQFSRDVVIRHDGKWFGLGTRHGVQHWSDGNHEERQTVATEYRLPYFLAGDGRSSDVIRKLYKGHYNRTVVDNSAAHSGRLTGLYFHAEVTGDPAHQLQLKRYAQTFVDAGRLSLAPAVSFPQVSLRGYGDMGDQMFFHYYGGWHTLLEYQQATGDLIIRDAILRTAEETMKDSALVASYHESVLRNPVNYTAVAFAAHHAKDPAPYAEFLNATLKQSGWQMLYQTVTHDSEHWSGSTAMLRGYIPGCFFWANWAPFITASLKTDTVWSPDIARQIKSYEETGTPGAPPSWHWQLEYDEVKELAPYLDYQKPWLAPQSMTNGRSK